MGLVINRAQCAGDAVDWCLAKRKIITIAGLSSLFPRPLRLSRIASYCAADAAFETIRAAIVFSMVGSSYFVLVSLVDCRCPPLLLVLLRVGDKRSDYDYAGQAGKLAGTFHQSKVRQ